MKILRRNVSKDELKEFLNQIDLNDKQLYSEVSDTQNFIFQFSGGTASRMVSDARPENFDDMICLNSYSRPGASFGFGNFCLIKNEGQKSVYPSQIQPFIEDGRGTICFQEQVMAIGNYLTGGKYNGDTWRRLLKKLGKAKKSPEDLEKWSKMVICAKETAPSLGISTQDIDLICDDLLTLSAYSFNKAHAAAYSYLAMEEVYLAKYFKPYFYATNLANEAGKKDAIETAIKNCKETGFNVLPPDINTSDTHFTPLSEGIRFGLNEIKGVGETPIPDIIFNRPYVSIIDCIIKNIDTHGYTKRITNALLCGGAFDELIHGQRSRYEKICNEFYEKKKTKKTPELLEQLWEDCEMLFPEEETTNEQYMEYEKAYLGGYFFHNVFSCLGDKIQKLYEKGYCLRNLQEVRMKNLPNAVCPVYAKNFMFKKDKNGNDMAFCEISDMNGETYRIPIFASYYQYCREQFRGDNLYLLSVYADEGDSIKFGSKRWIKDGEKIKRFVIPLGKYIS